MTGWVMFNYVIFVPCMQYQPWFKIREEVFTVYLEDFLK